MMHNNQIFQDEDDPAGLVSNPDGFRELGGEDEPWLFDRFLSESIPNHIPQPQDVSGPDPGHLDIHDGADESVTSQCSLLLPVHSTSKYES